MFVFNFQHDPFSADNVIKEESYGKSENEEQEINNSYTDNIINEEICNENESDKVLVYIEICIIEWN